jgi:hypothetical protein
MSNFVRWGDRIVPRCVCEPPDDIPPGECVECGGLGLIPEMVNDDRLDEMVPCYRCQKYCRECKEWVKKAAHECSE